MSNEALVLIITSLITILGWGSTFLIQRKILSETQKSQKKDREVNTFRARLPLIKEINNELFSMNLEFKSLQSLIKSTHFTVPEGTKILGKILDPLVRFRKLQFDLEFRSMQSYLPTKKAQEIYEKIKLINNLISEFGKVAILDEEDRTRDKEVFETLSMKINEIMPNISNLIEVISSEYAKTDKDMSC
jgi:hypothetical protein